MARPGTTIRDTFRPLKMPECVSSDGNRSIPIGPLPSGREFKAGVTAHLLAKYKRGAGYVR